MLMTKAKNCTLVIPGTFIACGEGGNYCSDGCEAVASMRGERDAARKHTEQALDAEQRARAELRISKATIKDLIERNRALFEALAPHDTQDPERPGWNKCGCCMTPENPLWGKP